jgi:hypothetical protein
MYEEVKHMDDVIPTIYTEMATDGENQSAELLDYYTRCDQTERAVINEVCIYLCGWSFETILAKCGIQLDENGNIKAQ